MTPATFLSILIPVYNYNVAPLLHRLHEQCLQVSEGSEIEILAADDGSVEKFNNVSEAEKLSLVCYHELDENVGRSAIRNYLLSLSRGSYVLFLDADMMPDHDNFVQTYFDLAQNGAEIVCGGISYQQYDHRDPSASFYLYKSQKTEVLSAAARNKSPWRYFFTSNILIRSDIIKNINFDQQFKGYGYEDIEWGIRLAKSYVIRHIDNTCSHLGVMGKDQAFCNMRDSIANYALLHQLHPKETENVGAMRLAGIIQYLPDALLSFADVLFRYLYAALSWNWFLFVVFQSDKVILLARKLKKQQEVIRE